MNAELFQYKVPHHELDAISSIGIQPQIQLELNRQVGCFPIGTVVIPKNYQSNFIISIINNQQISFAYSSAQLKKEEQPPEPYTITKRGELKKCGDSHQTWHIRFFELKHSKLSYKKNEKNINTIKSIKLQNVQITRQTETFFTLQTSQAERIWKFQARDKQDCEEWMRAIQQASISNQ